MRLGAHNSIAGGLHNAIAECVDIGGDTLQIFCKNQRQWTAKPYTPDEVKAWKDAVAAAKVGPIMVHDSYLINLGQPDDGKREAARKAFVDELQRSEQLGIAYLNFHPGSHVHDSKAMRDDRATRDACLDRIARAVASALDEVPGKVMAVIENAAGQGTNVGTSWEEVGRLADAIGKPGRVGITVDTQHSWAAGHDWLDRYDEVWDAFDGAVGLKRLVAFHLNDSKEPCGTRVDRHDALGQGHLGAGFFRVLMNDRRFDRCSGYLETPQEPSGWKTEIAWLRGLREG